MTRRVSWLLVGMCSAGLGAGCAGDLAKMITTNPDIRDKVMSTISGNGALAGMMVDRLMNADSTRTIVLDKLMANGGAVQAVMGRMAQDQTMVDGVLNLAVQDSSMRNHVLTLLKGMEMTAR